LNTPAFIARRIAFNRERSFSRFIIRLAIAATVISVGAMLITLAFVNGFQYTVGQKVFNLWGHVRVQHYSSSRATISEEEPIRKNDTVLRILQTTPHVRTIQAFATKYAVVRSGEGLDYIQVKGVEKNYDFDNLQGFLKKGGWPRFPDSGYSNQIVLSESTARLLRINVGDRILIYFIQPDGPPRVRPMFVCGLYKTGIDDYDKLIAIGDLRLIQRLNNWNAEEIGGYEIFTDDYRNADEVDDAVYRRLPDHWGSRTTEETYPNIFDWLQLQNKTVRIVLIIMAIVATLNLVTCLIVLVLERTHMIGILKSLGTTDWSIQRIFLYEGSLITLFGIALGNVFGLLVCWLQDRYGFVTLPEEAYFISKAEVRLEWWHFLLVDGGTFLICFLVLMIPTILVRNMQPARAIRFA
jgi:lipoprotein-releasing system permease protein